MGLLGWTEATATPLLEEALTRPKVKLIANALGTPPKEIIDRIHASGRLVAALRVTRRMMRWRPDRILCGCGREMMWAVVAAARLMRIPVVVAHRGTWRAAALLSIDWPDDGNLDGQTDEQVLLGGARGRASLGWSDSTPSIPGLSLIHI